LLVQGQIELGMQCECVRCLKTFDCPLLLKDWICHIPLEGEEAAPIVNDCVDLTPYIREDTLLAFPQHPLCEIECRGLAGSTSGRKSPAKSGDELNAAAPVWEELNKLKL
jgi:uncharacterized metal-binding protein YceD (DUF177 family)